MKLPDEENPPKRWVKSSYSLTNGNCVEVTGLHGQMLGVRDSQNPHGRILRFAPPEWNSFVGAVRDGKFGL